ncbi:type IV secretion system protein VirB3 [Rickettsia endosymbiont of Polydrusus tereticollis]|uniref:type IV secretion system protein VirB3 n=1 Tax=Rickettsia endosymbiont of Polydrusus tereticollis TaxID=3066251 RepID=UPI003132B59D|nr:type IV secretion system protein VirB3 [Rickettsia endosymbiont of Oxypoda opaca]
MAGNLSSDPLFVGLTRPAMIFGVSIKFAALNMITSMTLFIWNNGIAVLFVAGALHLIGYIICFKEPRFIELYLNKLSRTSQCPNKFYYGANSYST